MYHDRQLKPTPPTRPAASIRDDTIHVAFPRIYLVSNNSPVKISPSSFKSHEDGITRLLYKSLSFYVILIYIFKGQLFFILHKREILTFLQVQSHIITFTLPFQITNECRKLVQNLNMKRNHWKILALYSLNERIFPFPFSFLRTGVTILQWKSSVKGVDR